MIQASSLNFAAMTHAALGLVLLLGLPAGAQSPQAPVCIRSIDVDHTKVPNDHTILFFMKDGKIWSSTLRSACPELGFNGFAYGPTPPVEICSDMQTIRVLRSGAICELGPLVPATRQ